MLDITTLAAWGEFIGGIAVVVSLIYLAGQIRQNSRLLRASTASASSVTNTAGNTLLAQDPDLARIYLDGIADRSSLSEGDRLRFEALVTMWFNGWNQEYQFAADGVISPAVWNARRRSIGRLAELPGVRQTWSEWRGTYGDEFIDYMDGLIREVEVPE